LHAQRSAHNFRSVADAALCDTRTAARQVNEALKEEMKTIHALSIKRAVPPAAA
jgi:acid stress-induced BolA-like protein IbaG/YrbA